MNYYSYSGYRGRRSGTGGGGCGCGCGCNGEAKAVTPYQNSYAPTNPSSYQPANYPMYLGNQPVQQLAYQPSPLAMYPSTNQAANQAVNHPNYNHANQLAQQPMYKPASQMPTVNQMPMLPKSVNKPSSSPELLRLLEEAVSGESEDQAFYKQLIALAPTSVEKDIIAGIRDDEMSHYKQFRLIYRELTGKEISESREMTSDEQTLAYIANLRKALFGEIAAVKKYRVIRSELSSITHRDMLFDIITDELTHMGKYNYLITLNKRN